jgi:hypothetical protein
MSKTAKITSAILVFLAVAALTFLIWTSMSNIFHFHNETTCEIPERTTIEGFRFNPIICRWEEVPEPQNTPTATPTPTNTPTPAGQPMVPQGYTYCLPTAVTSLDNRPAMTINNTTVTLQVRDLDTCPRALWEHETGIATGQNYVVNMPAGWAVVIFPTTVAVHPEGGAQHEYLNQEIVVVHGPFKGGIGAYEAGVRVVPQEWIDDLINFFKPIQEAQAGHPVKIVHIRP